MDKRLEKMITEILCFTELATPDQKTKDLDGLEDFEVKIGAKGM